MKKNDKAFKSRIMWKMALGLSAYTAAYVFVIIVQSLMSLAIFGTLTIGTVVLLAVVSAVLIAGMVSFSVQFFRINVYGTTPPRKVVMGKGFWLRNAVDTAGGGNGQYAVPLICMWLFPIIPDFILGYIVAVNPEFAKSALFMNLFDFFQLGVLAVFMFSVVFEVVANHLWARNPFLELLGYGFYDGGAFEDDPKTRYVLISKDVLLPGDPVAVRDLPERGFKVVNKVWEDCGR